MDLTAVGRAIVVFGMALVVVGGLLVLFSRIPVLKHLGHLPGDIHFQGGNVACFFPIVSMIIISILLSLALSIIVRLINH